MMIDEPKHPTYGTLDELLADIARDIRAGYEVRIGQQGALHWFENEYGKRRHGSVPNVEVRRGPTTKGETK